MDANFHIHVHETTVPRTRRPGGGRKRKLEIVEGLGQRIVGLIPSRESAAFQWTTKSLKELVGELRIAGVEASRNIISRMLRLGGFQLSPNRKLPDARGPCDVDSQFEIVNKAVVAQLETGGPVILLLGGKIALTNRLLAKEAAFHHIPIEIASLDEDFDHQILTLPGGKAIAWAKERSKANKQEVIQRKRDATVLPLDNLVTDRDGGLFTAAVLEHWWNNVLCHHYPRNDHLLLLTHGGTPDCVSPEIWNWAMDRLAKKLAVTITVGRLPPSIWRCLADQYPLFSFNWRRFGKKEKNGFTVNGRLLCQSFCKCVEIGSIPPIGRNYPKTRNISKRVQRTFAIRRGAKYGDWNYSFTGDREGHDG